MLTNYGYFPTLRNGDRWIKEWDVTDAGMVLVSERMVTREEKLRKENRMGFLIGLVLGCVIGYYGPVLYGKFFGGEAGKGKKK